MSLPAGAAGTPESSGSKPKSPANLGIPIGSNHL